MELANLAKCLLLGLIILGTQIHGNKGCFEAERLALLNFKEFVGSDGADVDQLLSSWVDDPMSDCCKWECVMCNSTTGHVIELFLNNTRQNDMWKYLPYDNENIWFVKLSMFQQLKELRNLNLSYNGIGGFIDHDEGFETLSGLKELETLDLSYNFFNSSIFSSLGALTSLKSLIFRENYMEGSFPSKELSNLKNLEYLDASFNRFNSTLPFQGFERLKELDISGNWFNSSIFSSFDALISLKTLIVRAMSMSMAGSFPIQELNNLKNLETLDMSANYFNGSLSLEGFERLKVLDISWNKFNSSILLSLGALTSLKILKIEGNSMEGSFPIQGFEKLEELDISRNRFNNNILSSLGALTSLKSLILRENCMKGSFSIQELNNLTNLKILDLSGNQFNGSLLGLCKVKNLVELGLQENQFSGPLPECIGKLTNLQVLDLSFNQLSGNIQSIVSKLTSLKYLHLSGNEFEGLFSLSALANHSKLEAFMFSSGSSRLELETETPTWFPTFQLKFIDLPNRNLNVRTKAIPSFLLYQYDIRFIDLSDNMLVGTFPSWIFQNNSKLRVMNLMNNSFTGTFHLPNYKHDLLRLEISTNNITGVLPKEFGLVLSNLRYINMSRNNFDGNVPSSISEMPSLSFLDLSHNKFSGELPRSLFANCTPYGTLILSNNNFHGNIFPQNMNFRSLVMMDMKNNNFSVMTGVDVLDSPVLSFLDISNNKVSGSFPRQLCNLSSLEFLDLSENSLYGPMPSCFNASSLRFLFLQKNSLNGSISLLRVPNLVALDLTDNSFSGNIPSWISQLSELRVLLLGGNELNGSIPNQLCESRNVSIMDLSSNLLSGSIPSCFKNISFGNNASFRMIGISYFYFMGRGSGVIFTQEDGTIYLDLPRVTWNYGEFVEVEFAMKYRYNSYSGDIINLMAGIDLSCNELSGRIPPEIGDLHGIRSLNLSNNHLTGSIPVSFSNLRSLESLDLGNNNLNGEIPNELVALNFLGTFNVSYNNLSGRVLDKGQFGTFDENSYKGNPGLCGPLIHRSCKTDETSPPSPSVDVEEEDEGGIDMVWFYWSFCASYVTILLVLVAILCINRHWCMLWFNLVDICINSVSAWLFKTVFNQ